VKSPPLGKSTVIQREIKKQAEATESNESTFVLDSLVLCGGSHISGWFRVAALDLAERSWGR
jgi:hypothetical protein